MSRVAKQAFYGLVLGVSASLVFLPAAFVFYHIFMTGGCK